MAKKSPPKQRLQAVREDGLTPQQAKFVREFAWAPENARTAAIKAGYSADTASEQASRLLTNVRIVDAVKIQQKAIAEKFQMKKEKWTRELMLIAFADHGDIATWDDDRVTLKDSEELDPDERRTVGQVESQAGEFGRSVKVKQHDKIKALELLGKSMGFLDASGTKPDKSAIKAKLLSALGKFTGRPSDGGNQGEGQT